MVKKKLEDSKLADKITHDGDLDKKRWASNDQTMGFFYEQRDPET